MYALAGVVCEGATGFAVAGDDAVQGAGRNVCFLGKGGGGEEEEEEVTEVGVVHRGWLSWSPLLCVIKL